jgi:hypothetical protein
MRETILSAPYIFGRKEKCNAIFNEIDCLKIVPLLL